MNGLVVTVIIAVATILFAASVFVALYRVIRGPSILDRMIGTDVILASIMCGLGAFMAVTGRTDLLPVLIVLAMLGFVGSVSVSRYVSKSDSMTPGAEAGALSDFSASDWHMPKSETAATGDAQSAREAAWAEDVARGISNVPEGPVEITVRDEVVVPDPGPAEATTASATPDDERGEGAGSGPDAGPDDELAGESPDGAAGAAKGDGLAGPTDAVGRHRHDDGKGGHDGP